MSLDFEKFRKISPFANSKTTDYYKEDILKQAFEEFKLYQQYALNTHPIYLNGSTTPILATFQDVSDLEIRTDSKWMLTSLEHKINAGDIFKLHEKTWMCIYDKEKNTGICYKVKVQPCNYAVKFPLYNDNKSPFIYTADAIIMTYLTDMKDFKLSFPMEVGTTFVQIQYNEYTSKIHRESRIWLYDGAFQVSGVDFTNIDFYVNKGFLKWTLRPANNISNLDNVELGVCNYYDYFPKSESPTSQTVGSSSIKWVNENKSILPNSKLDLKVIASDGVNFTFVGDSLGSILTNATGNSCTLKTTKNVGILQVKASLVNNPSETSIIRLVVTDNIT